MLRGWIMYLNCFLFYGWFGLDDLKEVKLNKMY